MQNWLKKNLSRSFLSLILFCQVFWALNIVNSSEFRVNEYKNGNQLKPAITNLGDSKFVISFKSADKLYAKIYDSNGTNLTTEFIASQKSSDDTFEIESEIKSLNNGESFVITWNIDTRRIYAKIFSNLGKNLTDDMLIENSAAESSESSVCSLENGKYFVIVWKSYTKYLFSRIFYSNGSFFGPVIRVSTDTVSGNFYVTSLNQGSSYLIVWATTIVYGKIYYSNGTNMTSDYIINFYRTSFKYTPVASEIKNGFVVVWRDDRNDGDGNGIFARLFTSNGTGITTDFQVNEYYLSSQDNPRVASIDSGKKFVVTWVSEGQDSDGDGVYAKVYDSNGTNLTREFSVNSYTDFGQKDPDVTNILNGNSFAITWTSFMQDGSGTAIMAKLYSIKNCNNDLDYFYSHNNTCLSDCKLKGFTPTSISGILSCDFSCKNGLYYLESLSNCSDCKIKGYKAVKVSGLPYCELICGNSQYYHSYNDSCLDSCPIQLNMYNQTTENGAKLCNFMCNNDTYLLSFNNSCKPECNAYGFRPQIIDGKKICSFNCSFGSYFMTSSATCQSSCDSLAFNERNHSNYLFCDFKCSNPNHFYLPANKICYSTCPSMFYKNYTHHICSRCSEICSSCRDFSYCYTCIPPYQSKNGICVIPDLTNINNTNGTNNTNNTNNTNGTTNLNNTNSTNSINNTNVSSIPVYTPTYGRESIIGSLNLPSIQYLALSTDEKTVYITSNNGENLLAIDVQDLQNPTVINSISITNGQALELVDNIIYLADSSIGVNIFDATDPTSLILLSIIPAKNVENIVIDKSRKIALLLDSNGNLNLYSMGNLISPSFISQMPITSKNTAVYKMSLSNDEKRVYISASTGFYVIDISNPTQPAVLNSIENIFPKSHASNSLDSNFVYLTDTLGGIKVLDLTNIGSPNIVESIASSQTQGIACYLTNCYVSSGSNLILFGSDSMSSLVNKGAVPTYSLANSFEITQDTNYGFLIDGTTSLRVVDFKNSPLYFLYLKQNQMEIGRKYTDSLLIYNMAMGGTYILYLGSYKFSKISFYAVSFNPDSSLAKTFTNLPYWIGFDSSTNLISSNPDSAALIGRYNLYGAFSLPIPEDLFVGIGPIIDLEKSIDLIIHLSRYIDKNLYLTSDFDPNNPLILRLSEKPYEKEIRKKLAQYYFPMLTVVNVASSLKLNQNNDTRPYLSITTASLYSVSISLTFNSTKVRFMNTVTQALAKINEEGNYILLTAALSDLNQALLNLRVDMSDSIRSIDGTITVNDALNPPFATKITKMDRFFHKNSPPTVIIPIQKQIKSLSIVTGSQMNIFLDPNTFLDPDEDSLTYKLISTNGDDNLPSWIDFKNMILSGIPPDQFYYELTLIIRASDGYKTIEDKFTLKIEPSLWYLFQLGASFAGPIIGILGLWVYASKIYNIFCKRMYQYPRNFKVEANKELRTHDIYPIALLSEYLKEADILISMLKSQIKKDLNRISVSRMQLVEYFLSGDSPNYYIDEEKIRKKIKKIVSGTSSKFAALNLRNYFYNSKYSRNRICSLIIFKFHIWFMTHPSQHETRKVFQKLKKNWIQYVKVDNIESIGSDGLPKFFLKIAFDHYQKINAESLEKALISYAQLKHNLKTEMTQVKLSAKQTSNKQNLLERINNFLNGDASSASNDMEESERHGITYKIEYDIIFFKGIVSEYFRGRMLIVNIFNDSGKILRQFKIKEKSEFNNNYTKKSQVKISNPKLKDKWNLIESRPDNENQSENLILISNIGTEYTENNQNKMDSAPILNDENLVLNSIANEHRRPNKIEFIKKKTNRIMENRDGV